MGDMHFLLLTWLTAALIIWEVSWAAPRNAVADADSDNTGYITSPSTKNKPKKTDHDHSNPYDSSAVPQDDVQPPAEESGHNKPVEPITHSKSNKKPKAKKVPEKGNQCVLPPSFQKSLPEPDVNAYLALKPAVGGNLMYESKGIFQGDMVGFPATLDIPNQQILTPREVTAESFRWPNKLVPYVFYERIDPKSMQVALDAMEDLSNRTCIRFVQRTHQDDYLKISPGAACASAVGYKPGEHIVSINPGCEDDLGALQHEILHALGFIHEQSRPDRDPHVAIIDQNILPDSASQAQFYVFKNSLVMDLGVAYDYDSVMHYPMDAFSISKGSPTIIPREKRHLLGNRVELSPNDVLKVNRLYRCDDNPADHKKKRTPWAVAQDYEKSFKVWANLCDGKQDTPEGWDEDPDVCLKMCHRLDSKKLGSEGQNLINLPITQQCVHKKQLCDGKTTAAHNLIQDPETCHQFCRLGGFVSMPDSGQCIHISKLCNGKVDTRNEDDEDKKVCQETCNSNSSGLVGELFNSAESGMRCFKKTWLCDGRHPGPMSDKTYCVKYCKEGGFLPMPDSKQCVHWRKLCDGHVDTVSGEDEDPAVCQQQCDVASNDLAGQLFVMPNSSQCANKRWLCDGTQHDKDDFLEEEGYCREHCTGSGFIPADDNGQCIHTLDLCDGKSDTRNGWDEDVDNCQQFCKASGDWPPAGQHVELKETTSQCVVLDGAGRKVSGRMAAVKGAKSKSATPESSSSASSSAESESADSAKSVSKREVPDRSDIIFPFSWVLGNEEKPTKSGDMFKLLIRNNTHELLKCPAGTAITLESVDFALGGGGCSPQPSLKDVARKCDQLPVCGYIARDSCGSQDLLVRYSCAAPTSVFRTDPSAEDLCNHSTKNADPDVQCNLTAETLMP